jgi:WS/DGAT/MGAT family acyltransferase
VKQLSGLDATFLYMETPTTFGHVTGLMIFERPSADYDPFAAVYAKFASMVGELEPLRRRLVQVPFGLDHPYWVADPNLDLDFHIREIHLAKPGMVDQLADQVSRIVGRPMDRTRPLWEVYVIDGLHSGRWALLTKYHHATIDGAAGQLMLKIVTDPDPDAPPPGDSPTWEAEPLPSTVAAHGGPAGSKSLQGHAGSSTARQQGRRRRRCRQRQRRRRAGRSGGQGRRQTRPPQRAAHHPTDNAGAAHPVEQDDHQPSPLRHADNVVGERQGAQERHRRHGE